jgi:hypothetical protein
MMHNAHVDRHDMARQQDVIASEPENSDPKCRER